MSDFDRAAFDAALRTRRLGRSLLVRDQAGSTNDLAWEALAQGLPDGATVVAEAQSQGRGREGRRWHMAPGKGLALSVLLHQGCDRRSFGVISLVAGLALARALEPLGLRADLKWPNDLLVRGRKLSGILAESRRLPGARNPDSTIEAAVIGVGVNVGERPEDFPEAIRERSTSLAIEGCDTTREAVAAGFLNALEPLWYELQEGSREAVLEAWRARAGFWGQPVVVRTAGGELSGIARDLNPEGALVLRLESGIEIPVFAGDLELPSLEAS
ncbi:MAG: biotin--[acetyl-CoA-carboxylase] ligase [Candidatus Eisenbacteria bacterium]|uniref:biotin--[biotin carboxyl-carrier protein] ligase n=1 Tax=Eiseniibacteriota bacterium TaxID=2212470 RepID=A0A849SIM5_UNCEI|nr:biotin--[acetyl-CoA-carboxylase] ligase [Candidatus Eisenbacteria bacterium]